MDKTEPFSGPGEGALFGGILRSVPTDLLALFAVTAIATAAAVVPGVRTTPIRPVFGFLFVLTVPGYAILAAIFPEGPKQASKAESAPAIGRYEWGLLTTALSIGFVAAVGYVVNLSPFSISLASILVGTVVPTTGVLCIAVHRRRSLPPAAQFDSPVELGLSDFTRLISDELSGERAMLNAAVVVFILVSVVSFGFVLQQPPDKSPSLYLLSENEDGEQSATALPANGTAGAELSLVLGLDNYKHGQQYTVIITSQQAGEGGTKQTVGTFQLQRNSGDSIRRDLTIELPDTGGEYGFTFSLYRGDAGVQTTQSAFRTNTYNVTVAQ